jgi:hypothetical protein
MLEGEANDAPSSVYARVSAIRVKHCTFASRPAMPPRAHFGKCHSIMRDRLQNLRPANPVKNCEA